MAVYANLRENVEAKPEIVEAGMKALREYMAANPGQGEGEDIGMDDTMNPDSSMEIDEQVPLDGYGKSRELYYECLPVTVITGLLQSLAMVNGLQWMMMSC